jgi:N-acetyl-alpha-D-glucosaminyl L-malate synthase BshA
MNIGIICYPTYGGSGVVATELGISLAEKGHKVHFITYSEPARISNVLNPNLFYHEVNISNYPLFEYPPYELALTSTIVDVVKHQNLDLLHVHYAIPHASAAIMAKDILKTQGIDIPVITTLHGTDITLVGKDPSYEPVVTYSINRSDIVTSVSEDLKKDTYKHFAINRDIEVIPNFIDLEKFKKQHKDHFRSAICPNGEKLLVHTSNFRKVKRIDQVVRIFSEVSKVIPSKLLLIGDGPERPAIESLCRELGTSKDVRFLGKISDVEEVLSVSDVFLMPSEKESFGLAGLEAMACQVPVVSSDVGGLPEMNKNGFSGFTCPVGDVDAMIACTIEILSSDESLAKFKRQALERAKEFDIKEILPIYEAMYKRVLTKIR